MQCPFVNVYYEPQQYMYDYYISFRERHYEPQQWRCFEYLSVHYSKEEINIKQDFILSSWCQVNYVHLLRLMTNINQILIISCNIRWILILTSERNKALTFFMGGSDYSDGI